MSYPVLHPAIVSRALYWNSRKALRSYLGIQRPVVSSVLSAGTDSAFIRYEKVCRFYYDRLGKAANLSRQTACEIGCGDCLASADMLLGFGAGHVDLIETLPIAVDDAQRQVLAKFIGYEKFPNRNEVLGADGNLDLRKITVIPQFLEHVEGAEKYDVMLSYDVLEHVADVVGFFRNCQRLLHPGGIMIHKIDLSGHEFFEDPLPPLDFQTYPDWLYRLMNPRIGFPTRRLQGEFLKIIQELGFVVEDVGILRGADEAYIEALRPRLAPRDPPDAGPGTQGP